ncbi:MAG: type II secretion system F family protein [Elusimicrobia bacterium]|nr:type II secretion system F family protein [Elusimicrobiota bacterium]
MPVFTYRAKNMSGEVLSEKMEADSVKSVVSKLRSSGYYPVSIESDIQPQFILRGIRKGDVILFTQGLSDLISNGLSLAKSLNVLSRQNENRAMKNLISNIEKDIKEGSSFADALMLYPSLFSDLYIGMIRAGESSGLLETVLIRLSEFYEKEQEIISKIKSALAYPVVMFFVGIGCVLFLITFVIPKFIIMFQDIGQILPLPTRIIITLGNFMKDKWWLYLPVILVLAVFFVKFGKGKKGKIFFDELKLKLPVFGNLFKKEMVSRFVRTFGVLLSNGVPILDALKMTKDTIGNTIFADEIEQIYVSVKAGGGLIEPLRKSNIFPPVAVDIIAVGEESGDLVKSLQKIGDSYDKKIEYNIKTLTSLLEPIIILIVGIMVGFVAISMLLPIFQMSSAIY